MTPIRRGDGTGLNPQGFTEVRKGDGTVLWSAIPDSVEYHYPEENLSTDNWEESEGRGDLTGDFSVTTAFGGFNGMQLDGTASNSPISVSEPITIVTTLRLVDQQSSSRREGFLRHIESTSNGDWFGIAKGDFNTSGYGGEEPLQFYKGSVGKYNDPLYTFGEEFVLTAIFESSTITYRRNGSEVDSFSESDFEDQTSMEGLFLGESPEGEPGVSEDTITEISVIQGSDLQSDDIEKEEKRQMDKFGI